MNIVNPLHNSAFRKLFSAQVIALGGTGLSIVALTLLAYDLMGGNAAVRTRNSPSISIIDLYYI